MSDQSSINRMQAIDLDVSRLCPVDVVRHRL